jgi:hypothetical protein
LPNLRKLIASDITGSSLKASPIYEVPIDRVIAMGAADPLGSCLWRLKYAHDAGCYQRAVALLSLRAKSLVPTVELRFKFVRLVLQEWLDENCRACGGRRFIMASDDKPKHSCTMCDGTGLRRYSDQWRIRQLGVDPASYRGWERKFAALHQKIADADIRTWRQVASYLGWLDDQQDFQEVLAKHEARAKLAAVRADDNGAKLDDMPASLVSSAVG